MAWNQTLTLDIEGGVGGMEQLSCDCVLYNTLKVPCIQLPIHGSKLEVAALLEAPLAVFQVLAIMEPAVADVSRIANFTA